MNSVSHTKSLHYVNFLYKVPSMKIVGIKNEFRCAVLEPAESGDLEVLFKAKHLLYSDDNKDIEHNKREVLSAMEAEGSALFYNLFHDSRNTFFVLLREPDEIVGSVEIFNDRASKTAFFEASHVVSTLRGQRLINLLYETCEQYVLQNTDYTRIRLETKADGNASKNSAVRNGFVQTDVTSEGHLIFEKIL
ncbi:MAG: GNAT family N-acetyltransferase [Alphaproteobacteria bacterium]